MSKWSGNKLLAVVIICFVAIALFAGAAVAAVSYFNGGHGHHDDGEVGTCNSGGEHCNSGEECHEEGDCLSEEQCQEEGRCNLQECDHEEDHDCLEENHNEGESNPSREHGRGCHK